MVDQNLISELDAVDSGIEAELATVFAQDDSDERIRGLIDQEEGEFKSGSILTGTVVGRAGDVLVFDGESLPDLFKNEKDDSDDEVEREKLQSAIDWLNARGARPPP